MNYPAAYEKLTRDEMTYIEGGKDYEGLFNYFIGDYLRDNFRDQLRAAVWSSATEFSFKPFLDWINNLMHMSPVAQLGYLYGAVRLSEVVDGYLK